MPVDVGERQQGYAEGAWRPRCVEFRPCAFQRPDVFRRKLKSVHFRDPACAAVKYLGVSSLI